MFHLELGANQEGPEFVAPKVENSGQHQSEQEHPVQPLWVNSLSAVLNNKSLKREHCLTAHFLTADVVPVTMRAFVLFVVLNWILRSEFQSTIV